MNIQQHLFSEYLDPIKLKEGKQKCPCCQRPVKAYGYVITDKLVNLAYEITNWCSASSKLTFSPEEVFIGDYKALTQFQKLKMFGIIERTNHSGWWKLTKKGYKFLRGDIKLPRKVWVFADKVILKDDIFVSINQIEKCWKERSQDWTLDYILQPYQTEFQI